MSKNGARGTSASSTHDQIPVIDAKGLARTVSSLIGARIVILLAEAPDQLKVIAAVGTSIKQLPGAWLIKKDPGSITDIRVVNDPGRTPDLAAHPINSVVPPVKNLLVAWSPGNRDQTYCLLAIDPSRKAVSDRVILEGIQNMMGSLKKHSLPPLPNNTGFAEQQSVAGLAVSESQPVGDAVTRFLLNTLVSQRRLHTRGNVDFVSLRRWRASIKPFQLEALKALKASPSAELVNTAAGEVCAHAVRQLSAGSIKYVVPIPCGNSGKSDCLSVRLARKVASMLDATYFPVLTPAKPAPGGASHPRKSSKLAGYVCETLPDGPYLLIDDVATSGRHLELASTVLRAANQPVLAMAWLGMG